jgi:hypothetical protein
MQRVLPVSLRPHSAEYAERLRALFGERLVEVRLPDALDSEGIPL